MADPNDFLDDPEAAEAEAYANEMEEIDEDELALEERAQAI